MNNDQSQPNVLELTADIVTAFVSNNSIVSSELPVLIANVHGALQRLQGGADVVVEPVAEQVPAVSVKKSVTPDFIICLEDGKKFKSLKRHLQTAYGMTPDQYRAKWNLPSNYPMVAPNYSAKRSALATSIGLGQKRVGSGKAGRGRKAKAA